MRMLDLIFAARPMLHLPAWTIYLVALRYHHQLSGQHFSLRDFAVLAGITLLTAGAMYVNQIFDKESDAINGKVLFLQHGYLSDGNLMTGFLICSVVALTIAAFVSPVTLAIFLQLFFFSWTYSAPPLRLKDRPLWGLFANAYTFGFLISFSVMPEINFHNAGLLGWDNPFYFLLVVGAIHCLTTVPDRRGDAAAGKQTISVLLGAGGARVIALALLAGSIYVAYRSGYYLLEALSVVAVVLLFLNIFRARELMAHTPIKVPIVLLSLIAGYHYPFYLIFIIVLGWLTRLYYKRRFNMVYPSLT